MIFFSLYLLRSSSSFGVARPACLGFLTWGKRMGNKLEQLKRGHSRERLPSSAAESASLSASNTSLNSATSLKPVTRRKSRASRPPAAASSVTNEAQRSRSATSFLFRSSSTSQLSSAYYRCDDPSEDLVMSKPQQSSVSACSTPSSSRSAAVTGQHYYPTKTVSCENLTSLQAALHKMMHPPPTDVVATTAPAAAASAAGDQGDVFYSNASPSATPTSRKPAFPYAFLRSRLTSLPEEQPPSSSSSLSSSARPLPGTSINSQQPVSVPYDVNQIKAKMHQMYLDSTAGAGGVANKRSSSTSCLFTTTTMAPAYQHPPPPPSSVSTLSITIGHRGEADADSGIEKEASSDSSSLYGSDVSNGCHNSWEGDGRGASPAADNHGDCGPLQPEASDNNNKWSYRMRSRASSLDNVKLNETSSSSTSRKWTSSSPRKENNNKGNNSSGEPRKLTSFLRGHVRSVSFGRGSLTLPGRKASAAAATVKASSFTSSSTSSSATDRAVHFQIGQPTHYSTTGTGSNSSSCNGNNTGGQRVRDTPVSLPPLPPPPPPSTITTKQFRLIRLTKDETGELGIMITLKRGTDGSMQGFVIGHVEPGGAADR